MVSVSDGDGARRCCEDTAFRNISSCFSLGSRRFVISLLGVYECFRSFSFFLSCVFTNIFEVTRDCRDGVFALSFVLYSLY